MAGEQSQHYEVHYKSSDEYVALVTELLKNFANDWMTTRVMDSGFMSTSSSLLYQFKGGKCMYRYKDCRVLYYRFGGIKLTTRMGIMGEKIPVLVSPDGEAIPDIRTPFFAPTSWVSDPCPSQQLKHQEITLNAGKYLVTKAL